jgi:N-acetyl-1-D-myo-inositol-2-amino-2-deoxy-alpha-D-glucopyranoside deacetylase/mycothiol S-conjugate amidase
MPGSLNNRAAGALAAAPLAEVTGKVIAELRRLRPQVVITFDPIGGYRHPDHIAIHQATIKAFHAGGDPAQFPDAGPPYQPQKLYYVVFPRAMLKMAVRIMPLLGRDPRRYGANRDIDLVSLMSEDFPIHAVVNITGAAAQARLAASDCHRSQLDGAGSRGVLGLLARVLPQREVYMRAYPPVPPGAPREHDLFAGVT